MKNNLIVLSLACSAAVMLTACVSEFDSAAHTPTTSPVTVPEPSKRQKIVLTESDDRLSDGSSDAKKLRKLQSSHDRGAVMQLQSEQMAIWQPPVDRIPTEQREKHQVLDNNKLVLTATQPVSTFSIDVDTGAYSNVRRFLQSGSLPPVNAVRIEELLNYFDYHYAGPESSDQPFSVMSELGVTPWNEKTRLLHIGIQGYELEAEERPAANLVFLMDVSGSMASPNKLGLLKSSIKMMAKGLSAEDSVSMVVYAGASGVVLEPTPGNDTRAINAALDSLAAGGSTHGSAGIELAYQMAAKNFKKEGINRVLLATDGDFNVGISDIEKLKALIEQKREAGIALTTLGFGSGNYNDHLMEQLADVGNGAYAYIDTLSEAQKVLVDELGSTLMTIAKDVKIQVEFNPAVVNEYRLIGYVNRKLANEDFNNDKIDAGEIGAGHSVTALYEVALAGDGGELNTPLRYGSHSKDNGVDAKINGEIAELRLRYKQPDSNTSQLISSVITKDMLTSEHSEQFRFSAAVAAFGQQLRKSKYLGSFSLADTRALAHSAKGEDQFGYRAEFIQLLRLAETLYAGIEGYDNKSG